MNSLETLKIEKEERNKINSENKLRNIKSTYILQKIFNNISKKIYLKTIKNNRNIQKRLNININDYKKYSEIYSSIEIEIIPIKDALGKFINIREKDRKYFHIFFNDNKEKEIKSANLNNTEEISKINTIIDYQVKSFENLFSYGKCIESIFFKKFCRININNMSYMFSECSSLKKINLTNFNTDNISDMREMFSGCSSLKELNLSNFNTKNVERMNHMFERCSSLEKIDLSNFDTNNVINMLEMFNKCSSLK